MSASPDRLQELADLRKDLQIVRQRGLHNLGDRGGLHLRRLEPLARELTVADPQFRLDEALRALLDEAFPRIVDPDEARAEAMRDRIARSFGPYPALRSVTGAKDLQELSIRARFEGAYKPDTVRELYRQARHALADAIVVVMDAILIMLVVVQVIPEGAGRSTPRSCS